MHIESIEVATIAATGSASSDSCRSIVETDLDSLSISERVTSLLAGFLLMFASFLKIYDIATTSSAIQNLGGLFLAQYEAWLSTAILLSYSDIRVRFLARGTFAIFAIVSFLKVLNGSEDCGCFGVVKTTPAVSVAISVTILALMLIPTVPRYNTSAALRAAYLLPVFFCFFPVLLLIESSSESASLSFQTKNGIEVMSFYADRSIGTSFPLMPYLPDAEQLLIQKGNWQVLCVRDDCSGCQDFLRKRLPATQRTIVIHLPPAMTIQSTGTEIHTTLIGPARSQ